MRRIGSNRVPVRETWSISIAQVVDVGHVVVKARLLPPADVAVRVTVYSVHVVVGLKELLESTLLPTDSVNVPSEKPLPGLFLAKKLIWYDVLYTKLTGWYRAKPVPWMAT